MMMNNPNMRICLKKKRINLNRAAIASIGNPSHLCFRYDEQGGVLYFTPAAPDELDVYEIPKFYWTDVESTCEISRIAFLRALQYRLGWEDGSKYYYDGKVTTINNGPALAYDLLDGTRVR